jgi:hypothetical protein
LLDGREEVSLTASNIDYGQQQIYDSLATPDASQSQGGLGSGRHYRDPRAKRIWQWRSRRQGGQVPGYEQPETLKLGIGRWIWDHGDQSPLSSSRLLAGL